MSIVGSGIAENWDVASKIFNVLSDNGINVLMSSTSEIKITVVIPSEYAILAVRELHNKFRLFKINRHYLGDNYE